MLSSPVRQEVLGEFLQDEVSQLLAKRWNGHIHFICYASSNQNVGGGDDSDVILASKCRQHGMNFGVNLQIKAVGRFATT